MRTKAEKSEKVQQSKTSYSFNVNTGSTNKLRDIVITAVEASLRSNASMPPDKRVPILFISNPGFGKTTTIYNYAKKNGYHTEVLCGAHYAQDEILGFQTNEGGKSLVIKEPEWYSNIMAKHEEGIPTILFLDELSAVAPSTQGALYQLCFERRIRGNKHLPDDCLVVSAANYKANLPGYTDITSPTLNRFCIINLLPEDPNSIVAEYMNGALGDAVDNYPEFEKNELNDEQMKRIVVETAQMFKSMFNTYTSGSNVGFLDIKNTQYDGIFDRDDNNPDVLNFISLRTMSYLTRIIIACTTMGVDSKNEFFKKAVHGLIGLGTNTWGDIDETNIRLPKYLADIEVRFGKVLDSAIKRLNTKEGESTTKTKRLIDKDAVLANKIAEFVAIDNVEKYYHDDFAELTAEIAAKYGTDKMADHLKKLMSDEKEKKIFRIDMDELELLISDTEAGMLTIQRLRPYVVEFTKIYRTYKFYYDMTIIDEI